MLDIIIPTYNSGNTLRRCLESIASQNYLGSINVTIVNDGGNKDYNLTDLDLNIKELSYSKNRGPGYARNYALERTSSPFITFIDADDTFTEEAINSLMINIKDNNILVGFENRFDAEGNYETTYNMLNLHGKIYKRSIIEKYNIRFPEFVYSAEDTAFNWLYQFFINASLKILNRVVYNYNYSSDSIVNKDTKTEFYYGSNLRDLVKVGSWFLEELDKQGVEKERITPLREKLVAEFYSYYERGIITDVKTIEALKEFIHLNA